MINDGHTPNWTEWDAEKRCLRSYYEISDGVIAIKTEYFIDELVDINAEKRADAPKRYNDFMTPVASVPLNVMQKFVQPALDQRDDRYIAKWLNDSDHAKFRTRDGKL